MPKNSFLASLLKWKILPPTRTHPHSVPITNTYTVQLRKLPWRILQQYSIVRQHIKTHIPQKKASFSQNQAFWENFATAHFSLTRQNPALLRSAYSQQTYVSFFPITSRLESSGHKCTPSLSAFTAGKPHKIKSSKKWVGTTMSNGQLCRGNLPCHLSSSYSLPFRNLYSPTNIPTHSS